MTMNSVAPTTRSFELATLPTIAEALEPYQQWLRGRKLSERTVETYRKDLVRFAAWLEVQIGDTPQVGDITADRIEAHQAHLAHLKAATVIKALSALKSFTIWCIRRRYRSDNPLLEIDWPRKNRPLPRACSDEELAKVESFLAAPVSLLLTPTQRRTWLRDRRAITLLLYTGVRRSELVNLAWSDVRMSERIIIVRSGKGDKDRAIPMAERVLAALQEVPPAERSGYVIGHKDGTQLTDKAIGHLFDRAEARMRGDWDLKLSAHRLRHSFATQTLRAGADIRAVQELLGHASLNDTSRYTQVTGAQTRAAIDKLPSSFAEPISDLKARRLANLKTQCDACGAEITTASHARRFCSGACKHRYYRTHGATEAPTACVQCGGPLEPSTRGPKRRFCSGSCQKLAAKNRKGAAE